MSKDVYLLRQCSTEDSFHKITEQFQQKYFTNFGESWPKGFNFLFYSFPELVLPFYRNRKAPYPFLFQGSFYIESSNSIYKAKITKKNIRLSEVPLEMNEIVNCRTGENFKCEIRSKQLHNKLASSALNIPFESLKIFIQKYTQYSNDTFIQVCLRNSMKYVVQSSALLLLRDLGWKNGFVNAPLSSISPENHVCSFLLRYQEATIEQEHEDTSSSPYQVVLAKCSETFITASCSCQFPFLNGFPSSHIARVAIFYSEKSTRNENIKDMFGVR